MKNIFTLQNLFLLVIIVVLPVLVAYYSIANMIEEQYNANLASISSQLRQQIAVLGSVSTAEYQIKDFFQTITKDKKLIYQEPEVIKDFVDSVDKIYPGAFKWLFLDENYKALPMHFKQKLEASRYWQSCIHGGIYAYNRRMDGDTPDDYKKIKEDYAVSIFALQRIAGGLTKVEHIFSDPCKVVKNKWFKKDCYVIWDVAGRLYNEYGVAAGVDGACILMVMPEFLPENFWYKRVIVRRQTSKERFKFPIAAIDISNNVAFEFDSTLPKDESFVRRLINAYKSRDKDLFTYKNFIVGTTPAAMHSELRLLSMADLSELIEQKNYMKLLLSIASVFLIITSTAILILLKRVHFSGISLRQRIAAIFLIAMSLPLLSMISIGKTFISHEEERLKESAYVKMRAAIEALDMHYKDTPRLYERELLKKIESLFTVQPHTLDSIKKAMEKAIDLGLINHYVFFVNGKEKITSWENMEPILEKSLVYTASRLTEEEVEKEEGYKNSLKAAVEEEFGDMIEGLSGVTKIFERPTHLRHIVYSDQHMYFMVLQLPINGKKSPLYLYLPDKLVEKSFSELEFTTNNLANHESSFTTTVPELSFYSTVRGSQSYPPESPLWTVLRPILERSATLKIEERGEVRIEGENFLYMIKPLYSMNSQAYLPCLISSERPIEARVREVTILLAALSCFALLGSVLLSLVLSSSLLTPIKEIDSAAQQIGRGNLDVFLPEEGRDELGRLSVTFNDMVKGLREREKMQAYVSDSVLEAVKDNGDQAVNAGKHMEATILFSDMRNFTGISEANEPSKMFEVLNELFGGVEPIIRMNHGRVDKYIGDAVMAIFHQTLPEHHALSAVKAAVKMKQFVRLMNRQRKQKGLFPIEIGIGISTGTVLLGDVGSNRRKDLTVIGDEVNLASRLETASKQGKHSKIIFSGQTLKFVENLVEVEKMPFEEIRGKKQAVQIYELVKFINDSSDS